MSNFEWRAADSSGRARQGLIEASSEAVVQQHLRSRGLVPLAISEATTQAVTTNVFLGNAKADTKVRRGGANSKDVLAITTELAIMLRAGVSLDAALRVLIEMGDKPSVTSMLQEILKVVKEGSPLSRALLQYNALFGDFYINMVRSGESSGQIADVLTRLVSHIERLKALRENATSAMIYPAILLAVAMLSLAAMLGFVVPQFEKLFSDMGDSLPWPTWLIMNVAQVFRQWGLLLLGIIVLLVMWLARKLKSRGSRVYLQACLTRRHLQQTILIQR